MKSWRDPSPPSGQAARGARVRIVLAGVKLDDRSRFQPRAVVEPTQGCRASRCTASSRTSRAHRAALRVARFPDARMQPSRTPCMARIPPRHHVSCDAGRTLSSAGRPSPPQPPLANSALTLRTPPVQPTAPDTYRAPSSSPDAEPAPYVAPPKVSTAAHPSTLPGGGPSLQHSGDDSIHSGGEGVGGEKGGHGGSDGRYEYEDRPLNEDERRGLYVLGGILASGYALSWSTDPTRHRKVVHH